MPEPVHGTTMCAELVGDVLLVVHADVDPSEDEWERYCAYAGATRKAAGGTLRTLVVTSSDSGPDARQRATYKEMVAGPGNRVAVLCGGKMTRTVLTAMSWFNPEMRAFELQELEPAMAYLGAQATDGLQAAIERARQRLRGTRSKAM